MKSEKFRSSLLLEVAIIFLIGVITTGFLTYICETILYDSTVRMETEQHAEEIAEETKNAVTEYPAYGWLIKYWYEHPETMDIEYDAEMRGDTVTAAKAGTFTARHPDLQLRYMDEAACEALSEEDKQLYAEITYSWLITRINSIKRSYNVSFLFCVISEEPFDTQFFLFSGADEGAVRGTTYEEVYPLGNVVTVSESQTLAMKEAIKNTSHLADAGIYVDYYTLLYSFEGRSVLIGLTYDLSELKANINRQTITGATLAILNQLALSAICLVLVWIFALRPLKKVQYRIRQYKNTKESKAIIESLAQIRYRNEIGRLSEDVCEMVKEIDDHIENLQNITNERQRIQTELSLATRIQANMLPNEFPAFPDREDFDIYASMDPAKEVGGDFYDFFLVDENHLCIVMADVSGKGVPAALFMMASKIILKNNAMLKKTPAEILTDTNRAICGHNREEMFVTVWLGILDLSTGIITAANAGHEFPVMSGPEGRFELIKDKHGFVIGGMEGMRYKEYELRMEPGSRLFLYTDGVPEATNEENELFGTDRMIEALNSDLSAGPEGVLKQVRRAVDGFVKDAEQFDDLTMLCLEFKVKKKADE